MKTVLIFGGNGFIGAETLSLLVEKDNFNICLLNRDKSWDSQLKEKLFPGITKLFKWNRKRHLNENVEFVEWLETIESLDYVIDFSGYKPEYMVDSTELLRDSGCLYLFISTDSVYEVCDKHHSGLTRETDDRRPDDEKLRRKLEKSDKYGLKKWQCEQILKNSCMRHVILRLADVIGSGDSTERWWQLQAWIKSATNCDLPVYIPGDINNKPISIVYVRDVAQAILDIVCDNINANLAENNSFNLAFSQTTTINAIIAHITAELQCQHCIIKCCSNGHAPQYYPSVDKGPIDISKSQSLLSWSPSNLEDVVSETVKFYDSFAKRVCQRTNIGVFESLCEDLEGVYTEADFRKMKRELSNILFIKE